MSLLLGVLSDSYRRQLRRRGDTPAIDIVIDKVAALRESFGLQSLGLDLGVWQLPATNADYLNRLRDRLQSQRFVPSVILGGLSLQADEELWRPPLEAAIQQLDVAVALGSPFAMFFFGYGGRLTRDGRRRVAIEQVGALADAASARGIHLATENYDYFTSSDLAAIFDAVGPSRIGLNNDTGNWLILGEDPVEATHRMAPYTLHAHVRDYVLDNGVFRSVPVGRGQVDMPRVLDELARVGRRRDRLVLSVEMDLDAGPPTAEDAAVRECLAYMTAWLDRQGV